MLITPADFMNITSITPISCAPRSKCQALLLGSNMDAGERMKKPKYVQHHSTTTITTTTFKMDLIGSCIGIQ